MQISDKDLADFRAEVRAWFEENKPATPEFLLPQSFMEVSNDDQFHFLQDWQRKVYDAGYLGMAWPKEYGGGGKPQILQDIVSQEMLRQRTPFMTNTIGLNWAGPLILKMGSENQKQRYIKGILNADDIWCQGFSEPDNGSDLANAQTRAERDGDNYRINGSKIWTSLGAYAKYMILLARTNPEANSKYEGLSFFLADMTAPGVEVVPIRKLTGEYGFTQSFFTDAEVPAADMIGAEGEGWKVAMATLTFERGVTGGQAGGHAMNNASVQDVIEMAKRAYRAGKPAIADPAVREQLVQFLIEEKALALNGKRTRIRALVADYPHAVPLAGKLVRSEFNRRLNQFALSLQGGNAAYYVGDPQAVDGGLWQRGYFNAFSSTIGGGTSQIQKNILGERVLGLPKG